MNTNGTNSESGRRVKRFEIDIDADPLILPVTNGNRYIYLNIFAAHFGEDIVFKIRDYIAYILPRQSTESAVQLLDGVRLLSSLQDNESVSVTDRLLHRFKAHAETSINKQPFRKIKVWLLWDRVRSDKPILSREQAAIVQTWRFKNPAPYAAIRQGNDGVGPLSRREDLLLQAEVKIASDDEVVFLQVTGRQARTIVTAIRTLGLRPTQLAYAKLEDLKVWKHGGQRVGFLSIPNVKDGEAPRASFTKRRLLPDLLDMIERAIEDRAPGAVGGWLFPRREALETLPSGSPEEEYWRLRSLDQIVDSWIKRRGLKGANGKPLRGKPRRLRYTFATELAPRTSPIELAHLLGHKDQRSVMHYFTYGENFFERLSTMDGATQWGLAAASFTGLISDDPTEGGDGGPIAFGPELHLGSTPILNIGRCGAAARCRLFPPLSCYGCNRFRPDPDADHASVLRVMVQWRENRPSQVGKTKDPLQAQLDDVIEAAGYLVGILPAFLWTRDQLRNGRDRPSLVDISLATEVPIEVISKDKSILALREAWQSQKRGARRIAARKKKHG